MARYTNHRRTIGSPDVNPPPPRPTSTTITTKSCNPTTKTLDPTIPPSNSTKPFYMSNHFSRLNPNHRKIRRPTNHSTAKDIHMQAKYMTLSADSGLTIKPKFQLPHRTTNLTNGEKLPKKESFLEKRSPKDLNRKKQQKEQAGMEKKEFYSVTTKEIEGKEVEASRVSLSLVDRRRSLDGSRLEFGNILANCGVRVMSVDMPPFMQIHAIDFARKIHDSLEKFSSKTLALSLKKEFDGVYGPAWHCIVGTSFGSFVTHTVGGFFYFSMDQKLYILLFKTTVQRAD